MKLGISASAVLSQTDLLNELFRHGVDHIEIGLFETIEVADRFVRQVRARGKTVGIHSPLIRGGSKNDLLKSIDLPTEEAWEQVENELVWCRRSGVEYLLVHFPFVMHTEQLTLTQVNEGVRRLAALSRRIGVRIVCEPKLGEARNPAGIDWLRTSPNCIFSDAGLSLCWDIGDHLLASTSPSAYFKNFERWKHSISVVHLHNVRFEDQLYRWVPPHPSRSAVDAEYDLAPIIKRFLPGTTIVSEYTPQQVATAANIDTSYHYLKALTLEDGNA